MGGLSFRCTWWWCSKCLSSNLKIITCKICNCWIFFKHVTFCHKSRNKRSNGIPYWSKPHHIQKWRKYCTSQARNSDCVCNRDTRPLKCIPHWPLPIAFSICARFSPSLNEVESSTNWVGKMSKACKEQTPRGNRQNCSYAFGNLLWRVRSSTWVRKWLPIRMKWRPLLPAFDTWVLHLVWSRNGT